MVFTLILASAMNCGAMLTNSSGWFASPDTDFDGEYEFNADCTWIIRVPDNKIIYIHFLEFDVEDGLKCGYDYLRVRLLINGTKNLRWC